MPDLHPALETWQGPLFMTQFLDLAHSLAHFCSWLLLRRQGPAGKRGSTPALQ